MRNLRLSRRSVENAAPEAKRYTVWDTDIRGFGLRVSPAGVRSYVLQYRPKGAARAEPPKMVTIGQHGAVTTDQARAIAADLRGRIAKGEDPSRDTSWRSEGATVAELCDIYLADMKRRGVTDRGYNDAEQIIRLHIKPALGRLRVADVRESDVQLLVERAPAAAVANTMSAAGRRRRTVTGEGIKGHVVRTLRGMMKRAMSSAAPWNSMRRQGDDPTRGQKVRTWKRRERVPSPDEVKAIMRAMIDMEREGANVWAIRLFWLLILTGARVSEIMTAKREWIDDKRGALILAKHKTSRKTGEKAIPLSLLAMEAIAMTPAKPGNPYLIPGHIDGKPMVNPYKPWAAILARAGVRGLTLHDWRRGFASTGLGAGLTFETVGAILGHESVATTKGYSFMLMPERRRAAQTVGERVLAVLGQASPFSPALPPSSDTPDPPA